MMKAFVWQIFMLDVIVYVSLFFGISSIDLFRITRV